MSSHGWEAWLPMLVFLVEVSLFTAAARRLVRAAAAAGRRRALDGRPVSLLVALLRTLLICLVVPPVIYNRDRRGLHDLAAGTVTVRR